MPTPPNQIYSFNPTQVIVTNSFAENVKKLKSMCIPPQKIKILHIQSIERLTEILKIGRKWPFFRSSHKSVDSLPR